MEILYKKILILTCLVSAIGALIYRLYSLNWLGIIITLILSAILFFLFIKYKLISNTFESGKCKLSPLHLTVYIVPCILCWIILATSSTGNSITSPWQVIPWQFFLLYFLATLVLISYFFKKGYFSHLLFFLHSFLTFCAIWIIYKIGYGYDPFIHEASMELIKEKGSIDPKPIYYLGQYSLVIILSKVASIPIVILNKLLAPLSAAILALPAIYIYIRQKSSGSRKIMLALLLLLALPFSLATFTTPQNLSYVFLIITIFYTLSIPKKELMTSYLLALATFLIHPISGLPAIFFVLAIQAYYLKNILVKKLGLMLAFLATAISLPLSFYLINKGSGTRGISASGSILNINPLLFPNTENIFLNFAYLLKSNISWILIILSVCAFIYVWQKRNQYRRILINISLSLALLASYFLTKSLSFSFLIDYERSDYPGRILILAVIMFLPAILLLFLSISGKIIKQKRTIKYPILIFIALLITASLYVSYPRKDNYFDSHGLSVSATDIEAVSWIEADAGGKPYVVLANQQVSVAALRQIGFRYLDNGQFFYPIPTGNELYSYYLEMVYEQASREPMIKAMDFANVDTTYFVLNKYWWAFDKILKEAKLSADSFIDINNNLYIFKYEREQ